MTEWLDSERRERGVEDVRQCRIEPVDEYMGKMIED